MVSVARWTLRFPVSLHVGRGVRSVLATEGPGPWLLVSSARGRAQATSDAIVGPLLSERHVDYVDDVGVNPDVAYLQATAERLRAKGVAPEAVVGFGGGSALDSAKVIAALLATPCDVTLSTLLRDPSILRDVEVLRLIAVATTAGTGSEVTPFATVWDSICLAKESLASERVWPALAIVDADLMDELPREVTLATGLDALNQAAESIWNRRATPVTFELAARALEVGWPAWSRLLENGHDRQARASMAEASVLAGLAISQTRTALCHAISYPITARYGVAHGVACGFTMAAVARFLASGDDGRLDRLARRLLGPEAGAVALSEAFRSSLRAAGVPALVRKAVGSLDCLFALVSEMRSPGRADNLMAAVSSADIEALLADAWDGEHA